jgi:hypothetical protein
VVDAVLMLQFVQLEKQSSLVYFAGYSNLSGNIASSFLFSVLPHFSVLIEPESNFIGYNNFKKFDITIKAR